MKTRIAAVVALGLLLNACGGSTPPPEQPSAPATPTPPAGVMLAYAPAASAVLVYDVGDTTTSEIQAGPIGTIQVGLTARGVAELKFEPAAEKAKVTITFREFTGTFTNSAASGPATATAADMKSPAVMQVTPRGAFEWAQRPQLTPTFRTVAGGDNIFRRFFVRLPAGRVRIGSSWTDTLFVADTSEDGLSTKTTNIVRATWARDTTVNGRTLNAITYTADRTLEVTGLSQGIEIVQKLNGTATGYVLWDPALPGVYERDESITMSGTFDLPAMSMTGMPITAHGRARLKLKP